MSNPITQLWRCVWNMFAAGTVTAINDSGPVQLAQVKVGYMETHDNVPVLQQYGFSSVPPAGSDVQLLYWRGNRSNRVIINTNNQSQRTKGQASGESTMSNGYGMSIYLSKSGIVIQGGGVPVTVNGDLHVTGEVYRGFGGGDQVSVGQHQHGTGSTGVAAATTKPTAGT